MASARRVLQLLDEKEEVEEISGKKQAVSGDIKVENLSFSYEKEEVLRNVQATFKKGKITGIHGKSGSGKSTLLKLIMRFWNVSQGSISVHGVDLKDINTSDLRNMQSLVTQETVLFHDTIFNNIRIAKLDEMCIRDSLYTVSAYCFRIPFSILKVIDAYQIRARIYSS